MNETKRRTFRIPEATQQQLDDLKRWGVERDDTKVILKAIDRLHQQELARKRGKV